MTFCRFGQIDDYKDYTYEELLALREEVLKAISDFEDGIVSEDNWWRRPGLDMDYKFDLEFLSNLSKRIWNKFNSERESMFSAIRSGEFIPEENEGVVSQIKRHTKIKKEIQEDLNPDIIELTVNDSGSIEAYILGEAIGTATDIDDTFSYEMHEMNNAYLLLHAECHNWGFIGAGDWRQNDWEIYSDGSYNFTEIYNYSWEEFEAVSSDDVEQGKIISYSGIMEEEDFTRLTQALEQKIWRNVSLEVLDGTAWEIAMYDGKGNAIRTSGKLNNIKGNRSLEQIVECLPRGTKESFL